jgi:hypothetical protein
VRNASSNCLISRERAGRNLAAQLAQLGVSDLVASSSQSGVSEAHPALDLDLVDGRCGTCMRDAHDGSNPITTSLPELFKTH